MPRSGDDGGGGRLDAALAALDAGEHGVLLPGAELFDDGGVIRHLRLQRVRLRVAVGTHGVRVRQTLAQVAELLVEGALLLGGARWEVFREILGLEEFLGDGETRRGCVLGEAAEVLVYPLLRRAVHDVQASLQRRRGPVILHNLVVQALLEGIEAVGDVRLHLRTGRGRGRSAVALRGTFIFKCGRREGGPRRIRARRTALTMSSMMSRLRAGSTPILGLGGGMAMVDVTARRRDAAVCEDFVLRVVALVVGRHFIFQVKMYEVQSGAHEFRKTAAMR